MNNLELSDFLQLLPHDDPGGREWYDVGVKVYLRLSASDRRVIVVMDEDHSLLGVFVKLESNCDAIRWMAFHGKCIATARSIMDNPNAIVRNSAEDALSYARGGQQRVAYYTASSFEIDPLPFLNRSPFDW